MNRLETMFDQALLARLDQEPELIDRMIDTALKMAIDGHFKWWVMVADRIDALDSLDDLQAGSPEPPAPAIATPPATLPATPRHRAAG